MFLSCALASLRITFFPPPAFVKLAPAATWAEDRRQQGKAAILEHSGTTPCQRTHVNRLHAYCITDET